MLICRLEWQHVDFAVYIGYDLPAQRHNALSQPQVWPVSKVQMDKLRFWDDSKADRSAGPVVAVATIAGLRGGP